MLPIVAIEEDAVDHVPPVVVSLNVELEPSQTVVIPLINLGITLMVTLPDKGTEEQAVVEIFTRL